MILHFSWTLSLSINRILYFESNLWTVKETVQLIYLHKVVELNLESW